MAPLLHRAAIIKRANDKMPRQEDEQIKRWIWQHGYMKHSRHQGNHWHFWVTLTIRALATRHGPLGANMTSSTEPEIQNVVRGFLSHGHSNMYSKIPRGLEMSFLRYASGQTCWHTDRHTYTLIAIFRIPTEQRSNKCYIVSSDYLYFRAEVNEWKSGLITVMALWLIFFKFSYLRNYRVCCIETWKV